MKQILEQLEFIEVQIRLLDQQIEDYMQELDSPITTIPGVGPVYGAVILSELGNINRFPSGKQIVSYAGIDASVNESGSFKGNQASMSKRGLCLSEESDLRSCFRCFFGLIRNCRNTTKD